MIQTINTINKSLTAKPNSYNDRQFSDERFPLLSLIGTFLCLDAIDIDEELDRTPCHKTRVLTLAKSQVQKAYSTPEDRDAKLDVHMALNKLLQLRLNKPKPHQQSPEGAIILQAIETLIERGMLAAFHQSVPAAALAQAPTNPLAFQQYLRRLIKESRAFSHPFYSDFLANRATTQDIRAFLEAEISIDGRFDDLVALAQLGFSGNAKIVMGENYYDELGRGDPALMHTTLFESAMTEVGATARLDQKVPVEAYEAGNLAVVLASRRRYSYLSVGFLAATEFLVPHRFQHFMTGWLRNGLSEAGAVYHRNISASTGFMRATGLKS